MRLIVMPGDGIGPEITAAALVVAEAASRRFGLDLAYDHEDVGFVSLEKHGTTLRPAVLERAKSYDGIILGTQSHADYPPLVPLSVARLWTYAGHETLLGPIAFAGIVAACTVLTAGVSTVICV